MADVSRIENYFGYNSAACCLIKMKFGVRRRNHTYTKQVRWWKCLITKIHNIADVNILKMDIPTYLSRESSKVDEIWHTNANFDTAQEHDKQIWKRHKNKYNFQNTTKLMSNVLEAISKLRLKNSKKITFLF